MIRVIQVLVGQIKRFFGILLGSLGSLRVALDSIQSGLGLFDGLLGLLIGLVGLVLLVLQIIHGILGGDQSVLRGLNSLIGLLIQLPGSLGVLQGRILGGFRLLFAPVEIFFGGFVGIGQFAHDFLAVGNHILGILSRLIGVLDVFHGAVPVLVLLNGGIVILNGLCRGGVGRFQRVNGGIQLAHGVACPCQGALNLTGIGNAVLLIDHLCLGVVDGVAGGIHGVNGLLIPGNGNRLFVLELVHLLHIVRGGSGDGLDRCRGAQGRHNAKANGVYDFSGLLRVTHF